MKFDSKLEVGMPAMVIAVRNPKNSFTVGRIVTVEKIIPSGSTWRAVEEFIIPGDYDDEVCTNEVMTVCSGEWFDQHMWKPGYAFMAPDCLMPLPPLGDVDIMATTETPKETSKC